MNVNNLSIYMGDDAARTGRVQQPDHGSQDRKSVSASSLKEKLDPIEVKKQEAQKKALKIVGDAFSKDREMDDDLDARRQKVKSLQDEMGLAKGKIQELEDRRAALRGEYGVAEDSQEEAEVKLLAKEVDAKRKGSGVILTPEEKEQIAAIRERGLTEYQQRSIEMKEYEAPYEDVVTESDREIKTENAVVTATKIERLKTHTMVDAEKEGDTVMDAASKEIIGMLRDEAKDHITEELDKKVQQAEEKAEEKKKFEEKLEKAKEKKEEQAQRTEKLQNSAKKVIKEKSSVSNAQQEVKDMVQRMSLLEEDVKGAAVNKNT